MELNSFCFNPAAKLPHRPQFSFAEVQDAIIGVNAFMLTIDKLTSVLNPKGFKTGKIVEAQRAFFVDFASQSYNWGVTWNAMFSILNVQEIDVASMRAHICFCLTGGCLTKNHLPSFSSPLMTIAFLTYNDDGGVCTALEFAQKVDFSFKDLFLCENPLRPIGVEGAFKYNLLAAKDGSEIVRAKIVPKNVVKAA